MQPRQPTHSSAETLSPCALTARSLHVDTPPTVPTLTTSYVHGTSSASLLHHTVSQCLDASAQRWPDREAVIFLQDGIRKTFSQFQQDVSVGASTSGLVSSAHPAESIILVQVDKVAAGLLAVGLGPGDRMGIWGPNTYEWILFQFASAKAGIIMVSVWMNRVKL